MITAKNISVTYPAGVTALQSSSIHFLRSEFAVLLGPSGAGKSTLLRCLNLLVQPCSGEVDVEGIGNLRFGRSLREHRLRTGMIFQQHQLIERRTALENVLIGRLGYHSTLRSLWPLPRKDQEIALESLDRVGLLHKALQRVDHLSGGEQQRVGIARALAQKPRLILADEPVASLDPVTSERIMSLLHKVCREDRITAIVTLHRVELARSFADRVIGLSSGKVVFEGKPNDLSPEVLSEIYKGYRPMTSTQTEERRDRLREVRPHLAPIES